MDRPTNQLMGQALGVSHIGTRDTCDAVHIHDMQCEYTAGMLEHLRHWH